MSDFKRGAEAMRMMAAEAAEENHGNRHGDPCPDVIRALPLPDETCTCGTPTMTHDVACPEAEPTARETCATCGRRPDLAALRSCPDCQRAEPYCPHGGTMGASDCVHCSKPAEPTARDVAACSHCEGLPENWPCSNRNCEHFRCHACGAGRAVLAAEKGR